MANCPKCGKKIALTSIKPTCPSCGVNLLYYKIEERLEKQKASYSDYAPQEVPKLESAVIKTVGDTIIVAVTADNALASQIIK